MVLIKLGRGGQSEEVVRDGRHETISITPWWLAPVSFMNTLSCVIPGRTQVKQISSPHKTFCKRRFVPFLGAFITLMNVHSFIFPSSLPYLPSRASKQSSSCLLHSFPSSSMFLLLHTSELLHPLCSNLTSSPPHSSIHPIISSIQPLNLSGPACPPAICRNFSGFYPPHSPFPLSCTF